VSNELTDRQQTILAELVRSRRRPHDKVHRATIILHSAGGARNRQIAAMLGMSDMTVRLWCARWANAASQLAAAELEADEPTLRGLIQPV
jgi:transposase